MVSWKDWENHTPRFESPYVEWFHDLHTRRSGAKPVFVPQVVPRSLSDFRSLDNAASALSVVSGGAVGSDHNPYVILSPEFMTNQGFAGWWASQEDRTSWLPDAQSFDYPTVDSETIIAGVIDFGIAFGHRRFRTAEGRSRILGSWQQGAGVARTDLGDPAVPHLPFGNHLFQQDIDGLLRSHSVGQDLTAALDQDGFNRAAGLTLFQEVDGDRQLAQRAAHGTHVMGLVGGADPAHSEQAHFSRKVKFLVVTLPPEFAFGEGGAFLDFYLIYAMRWILEANARIAEKSGLSRPSPLVTNISLGKHAGAKDAAQPFVRALETGAGSGAAIDGVVARQPLHVVLPAGNANLDQAHASVDLTGSGSGKRACFDWHVPPEDDSSNFLEIWCEAASGWNGTKSPLEIELVPPGQVKAGTSAGKPGQVMELDSAGPNGQGRQPMARIYCERIDRVSSGEDGELDGPRYRYLVCLAPDRYRSDTLTGAPAGRWQVRMKNRTGAALAVDALVQTDQVVLPGSFAARRSYLGDASYDRFEADGRVRDSFAYPFGVGPTDSGDAENLDGAQYVRRHGSLNSYAANTNVATIAGYRTSDGRPAPYSSTGSGRVRGAKGRDAPTASLPTDDGYAHPGILSDGAKDGSVSALRGTSFASAAATRLVLEAWLNREHDPYGVPSIRRFLADKASRTRVPELWYRAPVARTKVGAGRIVADDPGRVKRL